MKKKAINQFLIDSVRKLDKINDVEVKLDGDLKKIIKDPIKWGEEQADKMIEENIDKYLQSKKLGEQFWDEVKSIS